MAKTDWRFTDTVIPEDLNGIGEEINGLRTEMSTRFDHEATTPLTLQPGLQVVHAEKDARFKLGEIRGRTLVNLLGVAGSCENETLYSQFSGSATPTFFTTTVDDAHTGTRGIRATWDTPDMGGSFAKYAPISLVEGRTYLASVYVKTNNTKMGGRVAIRKATGNVIAPTTQRSTSYTYSYLKFIADGTESGVGCFFEVNNLQGFISYDSVCVYQLSNEESIAIDGMSPEQISERYPFVPTGIIGVENPYVMNTSGNLLPPFYEWSIVEPDKVEIKAPYTLSLTNGTVGATIYTDLPAKAGDIFTLYGQIEDSNIKGYLTVGFYKDNELLSWGLEIYSNSDPSSFICPDGTTSIKIVCAVQESNSNTISYSNVILTVGPDLAPFRQQCKSMLAFQADLYANPEDSDDTDILFEQGGEYLKLTKWKKIVLDSSLEWEGAGNSGSTEQDPYFILRAKLPKRGIFNSQFVTKYDNFPLYKAQVGVWGQSDAAILADDNYIYISISNADSGWGVDYTPTAEEIKVYFLGWKMFVGGSGDVIPPYNGEGLRAWVGRTAYGFVANTETTALPLVSVAGYEPYQFLYRLANEIVEPVLSEGSLLITEGKNLVEVGTGIVLREKAPILENPNLAVAMGDVGNPSEFKIYKVIESYKNNIYDPTWYRSKINPYGLEKMRLDWGHYDRTAVYSITYIKLDRSLMQPFNGRLAGNEKLQISDLTAGVAEALQRVSVVEQKKAEKDARPKEPEWIFPTLLNGWVLSSNGAFPAQYYKDEIGIVHMNGVITGGAPDTIIFTLPAGFRPKTTHRVSVIMYSSTNYASAIISILPSGNVNVSFSGTVAHVPLHCSFLAEQ